MKRIVWGTSVLCLLLMAALAVSQDKNPTVKDIMTRAHKGSTSVLTMLGRELKAEEPDWPDVQKQTKELLTLGTSLGKNEPPKGSKESWQRLTQQYVRSAEALDKAAQDKDRAVAMATRLRIAGSCAACHKAHRP
jgi:cytochrome c556